MSLANGLFRTLAPQLLVDFRSRCLGYRNSTPSLPLQAYWLLNLRRVWQAVAWIQVICAPPALAATGQQFGNYVWTAPALGTVGSLGTVSYLPSSASQTIPVLRPMVQGAFGALSLSQAIWEAGPGRKPVLALTFRSAGHLQHVTVAPNLIGARLETVISANTPAISLVDYGSWQPKQMKLVPVPYYTGTVTLFPKLNLFGNAWYSWKATNATEQSGTVAKYSPRTDGTLLPVHETLSLAVSSNIDDVLPDTGNPISPYLQKLAGRMVIDIRDGDFASAALGLSAINGYGIGSCLVIIHDWQHYGYDNALPDQYPAQADLGGDPALIAATTAAGDAHCLIALHENYTDYYPNYPRFDPASVALNSDGSRIDSWFNASTGVQSYATKSSWLIKNATMESPIIHQRYGTSAAFVDVASAVAPGFHVDMDASVRGAGQEIAQVGAFANLWSYERATHGGPILGEGSDHWFYAGLIDGVEAQPGAGAIGLNSDAGIPLYVDFDLRHIHPLQVNHGMGYYERWTTEGTSLTTTGARDTYRMQEVAFGHAPYLSTPDWNDGSRAMVESNLVGPVAQRYGADAIQSIAYRLGTSWVSGSQAAPTGAFSQVRVVYMNGLSIVANAASAPLQWMGITLPQFGWAAHGPDITAFSALCGSIVCDYAATPTSLFVNARDQSDIRIGAVALAAPQALSVKPIGHANFLINYAWQVYQPIGLALTAFVHFVDDANITVNEGIIFAGDHAPSLPTSQWVPGQKIFDGPIATTIPANVPDGTYSIRVGLYDPSTGIRCPVAGRVDGTGRAIVGYLKVDNGLRMVSLQPPPTVPNDLRLNSSGAILDFPTARSDGMFIMSQAKENWILHPFPRFRNFTILLSADIYPMPQSVQALGGATPTVTPQSAGGYWRLPLNGASAYTWHATQ